MDKINLYKVNYWYICVPKYAMYMLFLVDIGPDFFINVTLSIMLNSLTVGGSGLFFQKPTEAVSKVWFWTGGQVINVL